jgi:thiol:disulfide interchange protein DsbD
MGTAAELSAREGASGAFFNGVLATALATPCTAPFLAGALGFAFSQPPGIIVLVFATAGLGLAAPYVLLSFEPAWLVLLPKPGAWMEHFRVAMGFPMLATALWLFTLVSRHYGTAGIFWIGIFLVFVAVAAWIWGVFVQRGQKHRGLAMALTALFLIGGYVLTLERQLQWRHPPRIASGQIPAVDTDGIPWQPWSRALVDQARASGRAVLVDFTADWCVTCQVNKKTSIEIEAVRQRVKERNILPLIGDYTLSSAPEAAPITEELKRFARAGVPLVLVYPRDPKKPPLELPPLLTPSIVLDALDQATK